MDDILEHRRRIEENISKGFNSGTFSPTDEDIEKARMYGDLFFKDGKTYIWTQYAPGKGDWHILKKTDRTPLGKGINGKHGAQAMKKVFADVDKSYTDETLMMLKRTPDGNWRFFYNGQNIGMAVDGETFTEAELRKENVCYQNRMVVDNFSLVDNYMEFNNPDEVYFVQVIKRWKDNKDKPDADAWRAAGRAKGSYNAGAEYLDYYLVHSAAELDALKPEIIKVCSYNNARAYISINSRNQAETTAYMQKWKQKYSPNDPRYKNAEAVLYGQAKSGPAWKNERFRVLLDIDIARDATVTLPNGKTVNVWDETEKRLNDLGIKVAAKYETPSGGLHLILNNKNNRNLAGFYKGLRDFDGGRDLGKQATVHPSEDIKMVLYSNVETGGY